MDTTLLTSDSFWGNPEPVSFQTSGSSGSPKDVVISKESLLISAAAVNEHLGVTADSTWGLALPLHHVGGFGVAARAYQAGCQLRQFPQRWNAHDFRNWIAQERITHTSLVPTQVHDLVAARLAAPRSLRAIVVGGGRLDTATGQAARDLGWPVLASYGMTEAASQIATQGLEQLSQPYRPHPIPLLPIWQCQVTGDGILSIAGPALFSGFTLNHCFTVRTTKWYQTSDRATLENGMISPLGRADFAVKVLGELVDLEALEKQLFILSEGYLTSGSFVIVAVPNDRRGYLLIPVFETPCDVPRIEQIVSAHTQSARTFERLASPLYTAVLPRTDLGKIRRAEVAKWVSQRLPHTPP